MPLLIILLLMTMPAAAQAASYQDVSGQIKIEVPNRSTQASSSGTYPLQVTWLLDAQWGTDPQCDAKSWSGTVRLIQTDLGDGTTLTVGNWALSSKSGGGSYNAPANNPYQAYSYTARAEYTAIRECGGAEEVAERAAEVEAQVPYVGDDPCDWKVKSVEGQVGVSRAGSSAPLTQADGVMVGDTVKTGRDGKLELNNGRASIRLSPGSRLQLKAAHCENRRKFSFRLFFGKVWSKVSNPLGTQDPIKIETGNTSGAPRGTEWITEARKVRGRYTTRIKTLSGTVAVIAKSNPSRKVLVKPGYKTEVVGNGPVRRPYR